MQIHSCFSFDSLSSPERIAEAAAKKGLNGFAITDHNVFRVDHVALQRKYPELIIVPGMEIGTEYGDILVYFIKEEIRTKKAEEVVDKAHEQDGIAVLAHPYHRKKYNYPESLLEKLDGIETRNSHNVDNSVLADELGKKCGKCLTGGSDAHFIFEIGNGYTSIDIDKSMGKDLKELKLALRKNSKPDCIRSPSWTFLVSQVIKYSKRLGLFTPPGGLR